MAAGTDIRLGVYPLWRVLAAESCGTRRENGWGFDFVFSIGVWRGLEMAAALGRDPGGGSRGVGTLHVFIWILGDGRYGHVCSAQQITRCLCFTRTGSRLSSMMLVLCNGVSPRPGTEYRGGVPAIWAGFRAGPHLMLLMNQHAGITTY